MAKNPRLRKCTRCKEYFDIFENDFIKEKNRFFDIECYKQKELKKGVSLEVIEEAIAVFLEQTKLEKAQREQELLQRAENSLRSKQLENNRAEYKELFITYLKETYGMVELPKTIYSKIALINSGNFKNLNVAIPYEHLLDMFKRKQKYLTKIYMHNVSKGKEMTPSQRLNYDIAVIINKYDDYLNWLNKQKVLESNNETKKEIKVDYSKLNISTKNTKNATDILSILDDLY